MLTTALFAVSHLQYNDFQLTTAAIGQLGYTAGAGLFLGILRARTGTLIWPVLAHATANALLKLVPAILG